MKKYLYLLLCVPLLLGACQGNEQKAEALIRAEIPTILPNVEGYEPIETMVTKATPSYFNDEEGRQQIKKVQSLYDQVAQTDSAAAEIQSRLVKFAPKLNSTRYETHEYKVAVNESIEMVKLRKVQMAALESEKYKLDKWNTATDATGTTVWQALHTFRCKGTDGTPITATYRFLLDKEMKKILYYEETNAEGYSRDRLFIERDLEKLLQSEQAKID